MKIDSGLGGVMPSNKPHAKKKKEKKPTSTSKGNKNNKAFNVANIVSTKRSMQRNLDKAQQKEVVPLMNREESVPPPVMVAVMGPKGVGKSTLIRSLVKIYSGQNITDTTGPITVVVNSKKRFTFFECPLDLFSMTDTAKIADLVLLLIDGSYGFEMETFEFLNILQLHGFPKVMGVLTHLDAFKSVKALQSTKKQIKHRFWTEIYKGAKLFDFMGVVNGKYRKHEVKRLSLHLNRVKFRPLVWKNTHSYMLIDRVEDVSQTNKKDGEDERLAGEKDVTLFGYVRGTHLKLSSKVHLLGVGDFPIHNMTILPDPCPVKGSKDGALENGDKKAILNRKKQKETLLYAPMANVGRVSMDKDALYIELKNVHYTKKDQLYVSDQQKYGSMGASDSMNGAVDEDGEETVTPMGLLRSMQSVKVGVDEQLQKNKRSLSLFANSNNDEEGDDYDEDEDDEQDVDEEDGYSENDDEEDEDNEGEDDGNDEEEDDEEEEDQSDDDDDDDNDIEEAEQIDELPSYENHDNDVDVKGSKLPAFRSGVPVAVKDDIMKLVYGDDWAANSSSKSQSKQNKPSQRERTDDSEEDDDFFSIKKPSFSSKSNLGGAYNRVWQDINRIDSSRFGLKQFLFANGTSFSTGPTTNYLKAVSHSSSTSSKKTVATGSSGSVGYALLRTRFVTGGFKNPIKANDNTGTDEEEEGGSDDEAYGDFEDLEGNEGGNTNSMKKKQQRNESGSEDDDESSDELDDEEAQDLENEKIDEELRKLNAQKKSLFKMKFDQQYDKKKQGEGSDEEGGKDNEGDENGGKKKGKKGSGKRGEEEEEEEEDDSLDILKQAQEQQAALTLRTREEFADVNDVAKLQYVGAAAGKYVRIHLRGVPAEFLDCFSSKRPVIIGGLSGNEAGVGYVTARVKRHRWHRRVLKSQDPIIVSLGWRRYQSIPVYSTTDANDRQRYLKYTPEHMHCMVTFYGPLVAPNTGILAYQVVHNTTTNFRIALTGTTMETSATPEVVKKLKLVGSPVKIYKNTAYITGMFTSNLEVAKFEHAKIKTVSGIRGTIKKALTERSDAEMIGGKGKHDKVGGYAPGTFRATFEDKILISDIIICRLWVPVNMKDFYNPVLSLLAAPDTVAQSSDGTGQSLTGKSEAAGGVVLMRTTAQLRKDYQVAQQVDKDSVYKQITRTQRDFGKVRVSAKLQAALPYASKPKLPKAKNPENYLSRRAVVLEPEEKKARALVQTLMTIKKDKDSKRKVANLKRSQEKQKQVLKETERFKEYHKEEKKRKYKEDGLADARKKKKKM